MRRWGSTTRGRRSRALVSLAAVALAASACGLGDKAELEDLITGAPARAEGTIVTGTVTVESRLYDLPDVGTGFAGGVLPAGASRDIPEGGVLFSTASMSFVLDLESNRASLTPPGDAAPSVLMDDLVYYGRRAGVPDDDARPWVRLDLSDLDDGAGELDPFVDDVAGAVSGIPPALLVDLVAGTLTGSIEHAGTQTIGEVATTRYAVNVALDKALEDQRRSRYPEDRREVVTDLLDALAVEGNVHPSSVSLDDDGRLRRFRIDLSQEPVPRVEFGLVVTIEIDGYGGELDLTVPEPREVLSVDSVLRFLSTVTDTAPSDEPPAAGPDLAIPEGLEDLVPPGLAEPTGDEP